MAYDINVTKHGVVFPSKVLAENGGEHIFDVKLTAAMDNGCVISRSSTWASGEFDVYTQAAAPNGFAGLIQAQAANGNWYVEITAPNGGLVIYNSEILPRDDEDLSQISMFYNANGDVVQAIETHRGDIFEFSAECFTTTPTSTSIGKAVTVSSATATLGKLVIGA